MNRIRQKLNDVLKKVRSRPGCHAPENKTSSASIDKIAIVGSPNVGKSAIFNELTGSYIVVSNYPGTTVEVSRGRVKFENTEFEVIDTPGMYSLLPITGEEKIARSIILEEKPSVIIQTVDAKNLEKMLPFTIELIESGLPVILNLNMIDEAEKVGLFIDREKLEEYLDIPVVETVATRGTNIDELKRKILFYSQKERKKRIADYGKEIESALAGIGSYLASDYSISKRSVGLLLLSGDIEILDVISKTEKAGYQSIKGILDEIRKKYSHPINYILTVERQKKALEITDKTTSQKKRPAPGLRERFNWITMNPWTGFPLFFLVLFSLYEFVGVFGAQIAVDFLEETVFGTYINPFVTRWVTAFIPWQIVQDLFVNDYGIITLGLRYAVAIILPIVFTFFIAFSVIEDTGYLPRLAMLIDRAFKKIGLNGRAVIPMVLGFGCGTMATMVTRTQETRRERIITTLLLALAVPCSAQLGVMLALLAGNWRAFLIWVAIISLVFILVGFLSSKVIPGEKPLFYMEVPPLRWPRFSNIFTKTIARVNWYFKEIFPLFIMASVVIWLGRITRIFDVLVNLIEYPVRWIGLPPDTAVAFLFGFFRRDYGAAGLYDLKVSGLLQGIPLVVAVVTLTLFLPCVAQFSMIIKERGLKAALVIGGFVSIFAFVVGGLLNLVLTYSGASI